MSNPKLTLDQAIAIRNDYRFLEGEVESTGGIEKEVHRVVVAPYETGAKYFAEYLKGGFDDRDDEEILASSFRPEAYSVYVLYHEVSIATIYSNIIETLRDMKREGIDLKKYGVR